jgi:uncharacterized protein YggT (Ycf19 family)
MEWQQVGPAKAGGHGRGETIMSSRVPEQSPVDREQIVVTREERAPEAVVAASATPVEAVPASAYSERVTVDYAAERQATLRKVSQFVGFVFGAIVALIGIRVVLRLIGANQENGFARFIDGVTAPFVAPFATLTGTPAIGAAALEVSSLIAMLVYALLGWALVKLLWIAFYRPATREVSTRDYQRQG